jgi:outer membrane lipoprotein SlyB
MGGSATGAATAASSSPNATVLAIEVVPRTAGGVSGAGSVGAAAVGGSGATGTTGSASGDQVFRVSLRMDDGSTQVITQEVTPDFRSGDRVNLTGGAIVH